MYMQASDARKEKRLGDVVRYHKHAKTCNIVLLVLVIVESIVFGIFGVPAVIAFFEVLTNNASSSL